ncbi:MAG: spermidine/putrescine transport system substrate-binding protein, partial [Thermoleophilaceae bacterium]|nr:spermidine/putrescine transport system substrate-binding protein [Thermoleophilaceae bacterium]
MALSRRDLLRSGAGLALGAGLGGCQLNSGVQADAGDTRKPFAKKIDGDLAYFNWGEYIDPGIVKDFEKRYGVKVRESNFDSMPGSMY